MSGFKVGAAMVAEIFWVLISLLSKEPISERPIVKRCSNNQGLRL